MRLEHEFNSLAAQSEACEACVCSQQREGWLSTRTRYDDGGFSVGRLERPALQRLLAEIRAGRIGIVVVYKGEPPTRSLVDFARLVEIFDSEGGLSRPGSRLRAEFRTKPAELRKPAGRITRARSQSGCRNR